MIKHFKLKSNVFTVEEDYVYSHYQHEYNILILIIIKKKIKNYPTHFFKIYIKKNLISYLGNLKNYINLKYFRMRAVEENNSFDVSIMEKWDTSRRD